MARVKGGTDTRKRRKRVLKLAKGYYGSKRSLFKNAKQQVMKSGQYAYRNSKQKRRNYRRLSFTRDDAAARMNDLSYNKLMHGLKLAGIQVNRKMLADLAINDEKAFAELDNQAKTALQ